jgi:hypothetical protein
MNTLHKQFVVAWAYTWQGVPYIYRFIDLYEIEKQQVINILEEKKDVTHLAPVRQVIISAKFREEPMEVFLIEVEDHVNEDDLVKYFNEDPCEAVKGFRECGVDIGNFGPKRLENLSQLRR